MSTATVPTNVLTGQPVSDDDLRNIASLARKQLNIESNIATLERALELQLEELKRVRDELLPDAMSAVGMSSFTLDDGSSVYVEPFYSGRIPTEDDCAKDASMLERRLAAFKWLRDNDLDAIIKRNLVLHFGKGQDREAEEVKQLLVSQGLTPDDKQNVHPMTLKAFIRERVESGHPIPTDLFNVYVGNRAKVTPIVKKNTA